MKHHLTSLLFAFALTPGFSQEGGAPAWAATQPDGGVVRVAVPAPENPRFAHLGWPKALKMKNAEGTLVLGYLAGPYHGGNGCPAVSVSRDGGKTFSAPQVLKEFGPEDELTNSGNLALVQAEDGALVLLAMGHSKTANNIFGWRSEDEARTWTPVDTSALGPNKTGSVTSCVVVPGVGLMASGHYRKGSPQEKGIWVASSADHGRTWGAPRMVNDLDAGEPVLVHAGGRLLIFIRGRGKDASLQFVSVSDDLGKTWKTERSTIVSSNGKGMAHPFAMVHPDKPEELLIIATERPLPGKSWLWSGNAKTLEFTRGRLLLDFPKIEGDPNTDFGYTWLVPMGKGRGLTFYYHGLGRGANAIWVAETALP